MRSLVLGVAMSAGMVSAATITTAVTNYAVATGGEAVGIFSQFNPALGTLTGVTLNWNSIVIAEQVTAYANQQGTSAIGTADLDNSVTLPEVPVLTNLFALNPANVSCVDPNSGGDVNTPCSLTVLFSIGPLAGSMALSPSPDFSSYIGLSNVSFIVNSDLTFVGTIIGDEGVTADLEQLTTQDGGNLSLTYTYTAASSQTPEPGSVVLVFAGLAVCCRKAFHKERWIFKVK